MQYLVVAYDEQDEDAPKRRMAARDAHLALIAKYKAAGNMKMGAALLDEQGNMVGSTLIVEFETPELLQAWFDEEPYLLQDVWGEVMVTQCKIAPSFVN